MAKELCTAQLASLARCFSFSAGLVKGTLVSIACSLALLFCGCLMWVAVVDQRSQLIPDTANLLLFIGGVAHSLFVRNQLFWEPFIAASVAGLFLYAVRAGFRMVRKQDGLGLGDVKFVAAAAPWVGILNMPLVLLMSCMSALSYVLLLEFQGHGMSGQSRIAFGPHLCVGVFFIWMFGVSLEQFAV